MAIQPQEKASPKKYLALATTTPLHHSATWPLAALLVTAAGTSHFISCLLSLLSFKITYLILLLRDYL